MSLTFKTTEMKNVFIFIMLTLPILALAQSAERQVIGAGGSFVSTANVQVSYTTGEVVITSSAPTITVGFQQGKDGLNTAILENIDQGFTANVYPNPATSEILVDLNLNQETLMSMRLLDVQGRATSVALQEVSVLGKQQYRMDVSALNAGTYLLYFESGDNRLGTVKVHKVK